MRPYLRRMAYLLPIALLAAGCGGSSGGKGNSQSGGGEQKILRASELVTAADAQKVLRVPVRLDAQEFNAGTSSCFYGGTNVQSGNPSSLAANLYLGSTEDLAKESYESSAKQGARMGSAQPLPNLGDEAQLAKGSPATIMIHARKGRLVLTLTAVGNANTMPSLEEMKSLAKRVVGQL
ncbi:MAG TPA: hypothetical protein VJT09_02130 [Pyrinomonadaceae bacterium]|nr:hypothetical protein [Pyrinomonadaceae bacterium]